MVAEDWFGWTVVTGGKAPAGVSPAVAALLSGVDTVTLIKGDPDAPDAWVHMGGVKGGDGPDANDPIDPDVLLDKARQEALFEEMRLAGHPVVGNDDQMTVAAVSWFTQQGDPEKAAFAAGARSRERERSSARALMAQAAAVSERE